MSPSMMKINFYRGFELRLSTIDLLRKGYYHYLVDTRNFPIGRFFIQIERLCKDCVQNRQSYQDTSRRMIENIARKSTVHRVLFGGDPTLEKLDKYCAEECSESHDQKKICFVA